MCSYFKNLWSLSPSGDGLRVTSVALVSQILFAPLRLGVLAIKMKRKVAKTPSRKVSSQHRSRRRTKSVSHGRRPPLTHENTLNQTAASRWLHALVRPHKISLHSNQALGRFRIYSMTTM